jgi:murein DD-endopeptidase MepM/ murein hydrolase activator NlpD
MHRRLLAGALVLMMLFSLAPVAFAQDAPPPEDPPAAETPPAEDPPAENPPAEEPPAEDPPAAYTPEITFDPTTVKENSRIGTVVGSLGLSGADPEANYSFALVDGKGAFHNSLFRIADGDVATAAALDFEALGAKLRIRIAAIDVKTEESVATQAFVVTLKRVDDITLKPATVAENAPAGTVVGAFSVPNAGGKLTYSTTTGDGHRHNYLFDVVDGKLVTTRALDFEELGSSLTVRIAASDGGGTVQHENAVTVTLTDVPDVVVDPNRVDENVEVGTVVGDLFVVGDDADAGYKFRFASGEGDSHNDAFDIVGGQLVTATEMDFETMGATLSVRIRAVDPATGEAVYTNAINIGVNDLDDEDPDNGAAEQEIIDALRPVCEPYGDEFVLLRFPQLDPGSSWHYSFGADRDGGERKHRGADIFGEKHTPVVAVAEGTVVRYGTGGRAGHYVVVEHEGGWESIYIHLNNDNFGTDDGAVSLTDALAPGIAPGVEVEAGQVLGWVGDSGNAEGTSAHTHFELWEGDHLADPHACLDQAWKWQVRVWELGDTIQ